jgi:hypothetical protein
MDRTDQLSRRSLLAGTALALAGRMPASGDELLDALDTDQPALSAVRARLAQGDLPGARAAFAQHLRSRSAPRWNVDPASPPKDASDQDLKEADDALSHAFTSVGIRHEFGATIDWAYNPTTQPGSPDAADHEWTWQLNRHSAWSTLARAYNRTADARYGRELARQIADWIRANPPPEGRALNSPFSRWRTIEAGIRMFGSWPDVFFRMLRSPEVLGDDVLLAMVNSMRRHAEYLDAHPTGGNWLCMEANGQFHVGVLFPEFRRAGVWRENALTRLRRELDAQVYPDGAQMELTPGYHNVALRNFVGTLRLAHRNDIALPDGYQSRLERMYDLNLRAMSPDRDVPALNDSWPVNVRSALAEGLTLFPHRRDWEWIARDGRSGTKPAEASLMFPYAGWAVMRSGWEPDARFLLMECGPFGLGHQHEDKLSFVLHAYGARLVYDAGSYAYDASDMRRYVLSARGHNVIHVDGMEQNRRGGPRTGYVVKAPVGMTWETGREYDYAAGSFGSLPEERWGQGRAQGFVHRRHVLFVKPDWWIVCDVVEPPDAAEHLYESTFHLDCPDASVSPGSVVRTRATGPNLAILPAALPGLEARIVSGRTEPSLQGWLPRAHGRTGADPRPCACFTRRAVGPAAFAYVFAPSPARDRCPVASVRALPRDASLIVAEIAPVRGAPYVVRLSAEGTLTLQHGSERLIEFGRKAPDRPPGAPAAMGHNGER